MMSMERQCDELVALMAALQTCVDRTGGLIPCRAADFAAYIARGRGMVGLADASARRKA